MRALCHAHGSVSLFATLPCRNIPCRSTVFRNVGFRTFTSAPPPAGMCPRCFPLALLVPSARKLATVPIRHRARAQAAARSFLILVPQIGSIEGVSIERSTLESHIIRPSPFFQGEFASLNEKVLNRTPLVIPRRRIPPDGWLVAPRCQHVEAPERAGDVLRTTGSGPSPAGGHVRRAGDRHGRGLLRETQGSSITHSSITCCADQSCTTDRPNPSITCACARHAPTARLPTSWCVLEHVRCSARRHGEDAAWCVPMGGSDPF